MSLENLSRRAQLMAALREFFAARQVLEVDVPLMGSHGVTDPYIQAITCDYQGKTFFLQTSPEYFMKRLLASGAPSIYYLGKAFRHDDSGRLHNPEFSLLEWYRLGFDDRKLMAELGDMLTFLQPGLELTKINYGDLFSVELGVNPHQASASELAELAGARLDFSLEAFKLADKNVWLDLLFSHLIEPNLQEPTIVFDYPESQCALARLELDRQGRRVAKRFELFWRGIEVANAYWELCDAGVQRQRFTQDLARRRQEGKAQPQLDEALLAAIASGLPDCAGIALGVDRLFMCLYDIADISQALSFPSSHS